MFQDIYITVHLWHRLNLATGQHLQYHLGRALFPQQLPKTACGTPASSTAVARDMLETLALFRLWRRQRKHKGRQERLQSFSSCNGQYQQLRHICV